MRELLLVQTQGYCCPECSLRPSGLVGLLSHVFVEVEQQTAFICEANVTFSLPPNWVNHYQVSKTQNYLFVSYRLLGPMM